MSVPAGLSDLLSRPMDGVARVVIVHEVHRKFRWLVILELSLCFIGCLILLPCLALAAFLGGSFDDVDLPEFRGRSHDWWQELVVRILDPAGRTIAEVRSRPADEAAAHGIVTAVLGAAQQQGVVVVETLLPFGSSAAETRHVWYGGRPLFASPAMRSEEAAAQVVLQAGWQLERQPEAVMLSHAAMPSGSIYAYVLLALLGFPLLPFLVFVPSGRRWLKDTWDDARGKPPPRVTYTIRAVALEVKTVRGDDVRDATIIDGGDLLGVVFGPSLSVSRREIRRLEPALSLVSSARQIPLAVPHELAPALRDLLTAAMVRLRSERPELGLLGGPRPTRCPWCSQLYVIEPGARCPSCGAPGVLG